MYDSKFFYISLFANISPNLLVESAGESVGFLIVALQGFVPAQGTQQEYGRTYNTA